MFKKGGWSWEKGGLRNKKGRFEKKYYNPHTYNNPENGCRKGFKYLCNLFAKNKLKITL